MEKLRRWSFRTGDREVSLASVLFTLRKHLANGLRADQVRNVLAERLAADAAGLPAEDILTELRLAKIVYSEYRQPAPPSSTGAYPLGMAPYEIYYLSDFGVQVVREMRESRL